MYTPRSFSLFVTVACAAFSTCAPILGSLPVVGGVAGQTPNLPAGLPSLPALPGLPGVGGVVGSVLPIRRQNLPSLPPTPIKLDSITGLLPGEMPAGVPHGGLPSRPVARQVGPIDTGDANLAIAIRHVGHHSLPEVFKGLAEKVTPVCAKLKAAVSVKADIDVDVVAGLLNDLIAILTEAIDEVQFIVDHPTDFVLSVAETVLSIPQVAALIATVLSIVIPVLGLVVATVGGAVAGVVLPLVATVGGLVTTLLALALGLVPGLLAALFPLIHGLISTIYFLSLGQLVGLLGLPALA